MAFGYFPSYQAYPYQQYQQPIQAPPQVPQQGIQNSGFISVRSIEEAFNWPVAPGNSLMFKDENSPYVYTKTRGISQLDQPIFEKYRLVKEEENQQQKQQETADFSSEIASLWEEVRHLQGEFKQLKQERPRGKKKEGTGDESDATVQ